MVRAAEQSGSQRPTEDRVFLIPHAVIVLDGASHPEALGGQDGGWLAQQLGTRLHQQLRVPTGSDLRDVLRSAIADCAETFDLTPGRAPSTTVSIVRWTTDTVEDLVLGDSPIVTLTRGGQVTELHDDRLAHIAHAEKAHLLATAARSPERAAAWRALVAAQQAHRNQRRGYWIAEAAPEAADHAITARWPRGDLDAVLVMTDGVANGVHRYRTPPTWQNAIDIARADPADLVALVHQIECTDPTLTMWPRTKQHDDKTLVLIEFNPADPPPGAPGRR